MKSNQPYIERSIIVPMGDAALEGLFVKGDRAPPCVVASPLPRMGGSMDSVVCAEVAYALSQRGHATLRFNYRGVGASSGEVEQELDHLQDLLAAVEHMQQTAAVPWVCLVGYSFGALLCAHLVAQQKVAQRVVLIAPPTAMFSMDLVSIVESGVQLSVIMAENDAYSAVSQTQDEVERAGGDCQVIAGADHFFGSGLSLLSKAVVSAVSAKPAID